MLAVPLAAQLACGPLLILITPSLSLALALRLAFACCRLPILNLITLSLCLAVALALPITGWSYFYRFSAFPRLRTRSDIMKIVANILLKRVSRQTAV